MVSGGVGGWTPTPHQAVPHSPVDGYQSPFRLGAGEVNLTLMTLLDRSRARQWRSEEEWRGVPLLRGIPRMPRGIRGMPPSGSGLCWGPAVAAENRWVLAWRGIQKDVDFRLTSFSI